MNSMPRGAFSSQEKRPHGYQKYAMQQFTPEQMELFQQLFGQVESDSFLSKLAGGDQSTFSQVEEPALRQFGELQAGLASRFSGMGMGGRQSSGFQNASTSAAQDFAGQLQSNRQNLQRQAIMDLMGLSNQLLNQRPTMQGFAAKDRDKKSGWGGVIGAGLGGLGGFALGGPAGGMAGAQLGYGVGSAF